MDADPDPPMQPPVAAQHPWQQRVHGEIVDDPWHWLADPRYPEVSDPAVLAYLRAENRWYDQWMAPHQALTDQLVEELRGRMEADEASVPWACGNHRFSWRFAPGADYRCWLRWPHEGDDPTVVLDERAEAAGHPNFSLGGFVPNRAGRWLAWAADFDGSERYTIRVRDLDSGEDLPDRIVGTLDAPVWCADNQSFIYTELNDQWRPCRVRWHRLGTAQAADPVLYEETDPGCFVSVGATTSGEWLTIASGDHTSNEVWLLAATDPGGPAHRVAPRRADHEYHLDHGAGAFWILTNDRHRNFRLVSAPTAHPQEEHWQERLPGSDHDYLQAVRAFRNALVISGRQQGLDRLRIFAPGEAPGTLGEDHLVAFPETVYSASLGINEEPAAPRLRIRYESMVTPPTTWDYDLETRQLTALRVRRIPSGYDPGQYTTTRIHLPVRDGVEVPVSLVYRRDIDLARAPLHAYAYGAYGMATDPGFSSARLTLLERGFIYAIVHVRGGDELGYHWYQQGRGRQRPNTFNDFVDGVRALGAAGYGDPQRLSAAGGSAGGELMAVAINQAPTLFAAVIAEVPFVDVLNTMLNADLPLTPLEWPEWGNPITSRDDFDLIRSYSPYDNVTAQDYPALLVTAGLNDPRVTYWEPAKWVARLRATRSSATGLPPGGQNDAPLLLHTDMSSGHGGKSGRYRSLRDVAAQYTFLLVVLGVHERAESAGSVGSPVSAGNADSVRSAGNADSAGGADGAGSVGSAVSAGSPDSADSAGSPVN